MTDAQKTKKIFDGKYEILGIVGRGARSVVYHARNILQDGGDVALKVLLSKKIQDSKSGELLRKEALAMISCRHPYVVRLDDFHSVGELCYLSMEFAPERDLRQYAQKNGGRLTVPQVEHFIQQSAQALSFIHKAGIVHRDLKPENILVINDKELRIADFGVALLPGETSTIDELSSGIGTLAYLAPEVLEGKDYGASADIYSIGVTFFEMLTGVQPFEKANMIEQLEVRRDDAVPSLRDLAPEAPDYLVAAIQKCMAFDVKDRFSSAQELLQGLITKNVSFQKDSNPKKQIAPEQPLAPEPVLTTEQFLAPEPPIEKFVEKPLQEFAPPSSVKETPYTIPASKPRALTTRLDNIDNLAIALSDFDEYSDLQSFVEDSQPPGNVVPPATPPLIQPPKSSNLLEPEQVDRFELGAIPDKTSEIANETVSMNDEQLSSRATVSIDRETVDQIRAQAANIRPGIAARRVTIGYIGGAVLILLLISKIIGSSSHSDKKAKSPEDITTTAGPEQLEAPANNQVQPEIKNDLTFPLLSSGIYIGAIRDLLPGQEHSLTIVSLANQKKLAVIIGIEGWTPRFISLDEKKVADKLRVAANGYILDLTAIAKDGELVGSYKNVLSGQYGVWKIRPTINK